MNATTVEQSATTPKTESTATALSANLQTGQEIKPFLQQCLDTHRSGDFSSLKRTAEAAAQHGFSNCANSRLVEFLADFQSNPVLTKHYEEEYPNCVFLPWTAFRRIVDVLKLWCDLPEHYAGTVPSEQIPWMDSFELLQSDDTKSNDFVEMLRQQGADPMKWEHTQRIDDLWYGQGFHGRASQSVVVIEAGMRSFRDSFFVMAPPEAFRTDRDFLYRMRSASNEAIIETIPPDDPLVVRFCHGGALVVAAWGEEAKELNAITRELEI